MNKQKDPEKILKDQLDQGKKITMLTAYDYPTARLLDESCVDIILVGDSLGMVALGYESTSQVSMEAMIHHAKAVSRAVKNAVIIGDMPYMSYQGSPEEAVKNAKLFIEEAQCHGVKLEGAEESLKAAQAIVQAGIPVMGHVGLTPQTAEKTGGFRVRGKLPDEAKCIFEGAILLEKAGCMALVIECVPEGLAKSISDKLTIPTIGIGAGRYCDGQVLVTNDLLGIFEKFTPKFVKKYADLSSEMKKAFREFQREVQEGVFPDSEHTYHEDSQEKDSAR